MVNRLKHMEKKNMKNELLRVLRFEQCVNNEDHSCVSKSTCDNGNRILSKTNTQGMQICVSFPDGLKSLYINL